MYQAVISNLDENDAVDVYKRQVLYLNENYLHIPLDTPVNYTMPQLSSIIMTVLIGGAFIYLGSLCFKNKKDIIEA